MKCLQCHQTFSPRGNRKTCYQCRPPVPRVQPPSDGTLRKIGKVWYGSFQYKGKQHQFSTGQKSKARAREVLRQQRAKAAEGFRLPGDERTVTMGHMVELLRDSHIDQERKSTKTAIVVIRHLLAYFARPVTTRVKDTTWDDLIQAGHCRAVNTIDEESIDAYRQHRLQSAGKSTINREVSKLHKGLMLLHRRKRLATLPTFPQAYKEPKARQGFLELDQVQAICEELPGYLAPVFLFAFWSGWRSSEIRGLTWEQVDLQDGLITLPDSKSGEPRTLPIFPQIREILEQQLANRPDPFCSWVFPNPKAQKIGDYFATLRRARRRAGYPDALLHDNRRSAVRNLIRAGVPQAVAMAWTGHKTPSVFFRYNIVSGADLQEAASKLQDYMAGKKRTATKKVARMPRAGSGSKRSK